MPPRNGQQPIPRIPKSGATKALQKKIESGLIAVPRGPFGIFGETVMTVAEFQRRSQKRQPAQRKKPTSHKSTQKRWIVPGLLYVETKPRKASSSKKKRWIVWPFLYR
jgi:hypothetical protein